MKKTLVLVKLGGSLITDKKKVFTARDKIIKRLAGELRQAIKKYSGVIILGHGGGSYPHVPATKYQTAKGVVNKQSYQGIAEVQDAAARLNRLVVGALLKEGVKAVSLNPSSFMIAEKGSIKKAFWPVLEKLLTFKMLPVVYGDVALDDKMGCCILSTEKILNFMAAKLKRNYKIDSIIECGETDGVYDEKGKTIKQITPDNFKEVTKAISGSGGIDVTGGMLHKVTEALEVAKKYRIKTIIVNGIQASNLKKAVLGKKVQGTTINL